jgi:hypothetical protein
MPTGNTLRGIFSLQLERASRAVPFFNGRRCHSLIHFPSLKMITMPFSENLFAVSKYHIGYEIFTPSLSVNRQ